MGKFNEELVKAGVMLAGEGLQPSSKGARVRFSGGKRTVIDGPFAETKELIAGFWLWQVQVDGGGDRVGQAVPRTRRADESEIEIRQVFEAEDFGEEFTPELREQEERLRAADRREEPEDAAVTELAERRHRAIDAVWRIESARLIAGARAHGARRRPRRGPGAGRAGGGAGAVAGVRRSRQPGAWLMATAKHRAIDSLRRGKMLERKHAGARPRAGGSGSSTSAPDLDAALDDHVGDDLLRLDLHRLPSGAVAPRRGSR